MFISKTEFEKLQHIARAKELEVLALKATIRNKDETIRLMERDLRHMNSVCKELSEGISAKAGHCKIGAWCKDCVHLKQYCERPRDHYAVHTASAYPWNIDVKFATRSEDGVVTYCAKHLHDLCPEMKLKSN